MARDAELRARITADDQASKVIDELADKTDALEGEKIEIAVDAEVDAALRSFDDLLTEVKQIEAAADALGSALGPELAAKADMRGVVVDLQSMGVTFDQISANADQFAGKLKELSAADVGGKLGANLGTARGKLDEVGASANSSRSALANMVGNSAQDLGALAGVAGSAGVGIGQLAEYMADAKLSGEGLGSVLKNFAGVAGPMAAIAAVTQVLGAHMEKIAATKAFEKERVADFAEAMADASVSASELAEVLQAGEDTSGIFVRLGNETKNVDESVAELFGTFQQFDAQVRKGADGYDVWADAQLAAAEAAGASKQELVDLGVALDAARDGTVGGEAAARAMAAGYTDVVSSAAALGAATSGVASGSEDAAFAEQFYGDALEDTGDAEKAATDAIKENANAMAEWAAETEQATKAAQDYAAITSSTDWGAASIEGATAGAERFAEAQFGLVNIAAGAEAAYDSLNAAIEENGYTFDLNTEAGRANAEQIQNLYSAQIPAMAAAYADADGDISTFGASMDTLRTGVMQQLREETSLTEEQIAGVVDQMGLVPANVSSQFEMMGVEDANAKLALLSGVIGSLPENVQRQVTLAVLAGDPQLAIDTIEASVSGAELPPAVVDTEVTTQQATSDLKDFTAEDRSTNPVKVDANTAAAISTMLYLKVLAMALQPVVTVVADTFPARLALGALAITTTKTSVDAVLREYPSASEIADRIGTVRVPVDTYLRNEVRITGAR